MDEHYDPDRDHRWMLVVGAGLTVALLLVAATVYAFIYRESQMLLPLVATAVAVFMVAWRHYFGGGGGAR